MTSGSSAIIDDEPGPSGYELSGFLSAKLMEVLGDKFLLFLVPVSVYIATKDIRFSGVVTIVQWLPRVVLQPFLSTAINGLPFRVQVLAISLLKVAMCLLMAVLFSNTTVILASIGVISLLNGCSFINLESVSAALKDKSNRASFQSHVQAIDRTGRILGPAMGGYVLVHFQFRSGCVLAALLFLSNITILFLRLDISIETRCMRLRMVIKEVGLAARHIFDTPPLLLLLLIMMVGNLLEGMLLTFLPKTVVAMAGKTTAVISYIEIGTAVFTIITLRILPYVFKGLEPAVNKLFTPALWMMVLSCLIFSLAPNVVYAAVGFALFFVAQSISTVYIRVHRIEYVSAALFASTMGVSLSLVQTTLPLAGYLIILLTPSISQRSILIFTALFAGACLWLIRHLYTPFEMTAFLRSR